MTTAAKRPTLADVAALAGTSTAVVSYVVNGGPRTVADATRRRVEDAIEELGYRRDPIAGALSAGRSNLLGLVVPDSANSFFSELARQVEREARARGLLTLLGSTGYDPAVEEDYLTAFSDLRPKGIFVASIGRGAHSRIGAPHVYLHSAPDDAGEPSVVFDDEGGAADAVRHLIEHGHRDVHCVTGPTSFGPAGRRERGWRRTARAAGMPVDDRLHRMPFDRVGAERGMYETLQRIDRPAALFATTDEQAIAALRAAAVLGLRVPEDVAIVGFDGIQEALHGSVRLTTVSVSMRELALRAFQALDAEPAEGVTQRPHVLSGTLAIGETCGCR